MDMIVIWYMIGLTREEIFFKRGMRMPLKRLKGSLLKEKGRGILAHLSMWEILPIKCKDRAKRQGWL